MSKLSKYVSVTFRTQSGTGIRGSVLKGLDTPSEPFVLSFSGFGEPNEKGFISAFFRSDSVPGVIVAMLDTHLELLIKEGNVVQLGDELLLQVNPPRGYSLEEFDSGTKPTVEFVKELKSSKGSK
jgi:hypothetical protein